MSFGFHFDVQHQKILKVHLHERFYRKERNGFVGHGRNFTCLGSLGSTVTTTLVCGSTKVCQIFYFAACIWSKVVESIFPLKRIHWTHVLPNFSIWLCRQGFFNKDPIVWLDGARPANICIPSSFLGMHLRNCAVHPAPKIFLQVFKNEQNSVNLHFLFQKISGKVWQTLFWQLWVCRTWNFFIFISPTNLLHTFILALFKVLRQGSITVLLTSCLTGLESAVWQLTIFVFICKTDYSKPVKQEVNGTMILPPLVFPG